MENYKYSDIFPIPDKGLLALMISTWAGASPEKEFFNSTLQLWQGIKNVDFYTKYDGLAVSRLIAIMHKNNVPNTEIVEHIRMSLLDRYYSKWTKLVALIQKDYDPLAPFDIVLTEESTDTFRTIEDQYTKTGSSSTIDKDTTTTNKSVESSKGYTNFDRVNEDKDSETTVSNDKVNSTQDNSIYGFNSSNAVPSDRSESSTEYSSETKTDEYNIINSNGGGEENTTDTISGTESKDRSLTGTTSDTTSHKYSRENPKTREYNRKGNIGNITFQQLFEQERQKLEYLIYNTIFDDIAKVVFANRYID